LEEHTEEDKQEILQIYQDLVKQRELEDIIQREKMAQEWSETKGVSKNKNSELLSSVLETFQL